MVLEVYIGLCMSFCRPTPRTGRPQLGPSFGTTIPNPSTMRGASRPLGTWHQVCHVPISDAVSIRILCFKITCRFGTSCFAATVSARARGLESLNVGRSRLARESVWVSMQPNQLQTAKGWPTEFQQRLFNYPSSVRFSRSFEPSVSIDLAFITRFRRAAVTSGS